ncbi:MAG: hypothetical protein H0V66_11160 [Bdellovibrionales bacterium]|nr:hypothetical protein [Bdellovibrionales bacterium]
MKKFLIFGALLISTSAFAQQLPTSLTQDQIDDVSGEFAVNLSHTAVAAPETKGMWGVEVGIVGGKTKSPELAGLVDDAGEDGSDFKSIYHAGLMGRAHIWNVFLELSILPEREISDITIGNKSFGLGWNAGDTFDLPLDVAIGANFSNSDIKFKQEINNDSTGNTPVQSEISFDAKTKVYWVGVSKEFLFFTPYAKVGTASFEADIDVSNGSIFANEKSSEKGEGSGGYYALGANLQFLLFRFGIEASKTIDVSRISGKFSVAF